MLMAVQGMRKSVHRGVSQSQNPSELNTNHEDRHLCRIDCALVEGLWSSLDGGLQREVQMTEGTVNNAKDGELCSTAGSGERMQQAAHGV